MDVRPPLPQAEGALKPTLVAAAGFDATADALNLRDAMKGLGEERKL